jgi:hypothetical protein
MGVDVFRRFVALAGGSNAPIVVIPTALGAAQYSSNEVDVVWLKLAGATHITLLHTFDPKIADSEHFVAPLMAAKGVWLGSGRQWILADAYLHTRTQHEIEAVLDRGGVVGGVSAGATFLGSYLVRGAVENDTTMMSPGHEEGLGMISTRSSPPIPSFSASASTRAPPSSCEVSNSRSSARARCSCTTARPGRMGNGTSPLAPATGTTSRSSSA